MIAPRTTSSTASAGSGDAQDTSNAIRSRYQAAIPSTQLADVRSGMSPRPEGVRDGWSRRSCRTSREARRARERGTRGRSVQYGVHRPGENTLLARPYVCRSLPVTRAGEGAGGPRSWARRTARRDVCCAGNTSGPLSRPPRVCSRGVCPPLLCSDGDTNVSGAAIQHDFEATIRLCTAPCIVLLSFV